MHSLHVTFCLIVSGHFNKYVPKINKCTKRAGGKTGQTFFLFSIATPKTRLERKLISLLGCCLINFLFEGCPIWCLWCLPPVHS